MPSIPCKFQINYNSLGNKTKSASKCLFFIDFSNVFLSELSQVNENVVHEFSNLPFYSRLVII